MLAPSASVTPAALITTVQDSEFAKLMAGVSVYVVGPPLATAATAPLVVQVIEYQVPVVVTGSLNVTLMMALVATPEAPLAGTVVVTLGGVLTTTPQGAAGDAVLRGVGVPTTKSALLLLV